MRLLIILILSGSLLSACIDEAESESLENKFNVEIWADNWFEMFVNGEKVLEDSVPITTERSFNAEKGSFETTLPAQIAFIMKDFKQNDTGLEYIGSNRQQMGDGGFIAQIKNAETGETVAVTDNTMKCFVTHYAPLQSSCASEDNPVAGQGACGFKATDEPSGWKDADFGDSGWDNATVHSAQEVRPKDGYDEITWDSNAKLIWGEDLQKDNTVLCRMTLGNVSVNTSKTAPTPAPASDRCKAVKMSVEDAGFTDSVTVSCDGDHAFLASDTYPDHELMTGIVNTNEQVPVPGRDYAAPVRLNPTLTNTPVTRDSSLAVAVNGVPIFDYTGGGEMSIKELYHHQIKHDTIETQQLDICGGHAGRGDDYHYHKRPDCMIEKMKNKGDDAIIGWAFDGFPIYGDKNPDGTDIAPETLDVCNGQADATYGYRYHTSQGAPYIIQCLMGEAMDMKDLPRISPLKAATGSEQKTTGRPPRGGVENLVFTDNADGKRSMTYYYEGEKYYIKYEPSSTPNCYNFQSYMVTDKLVRKGEYCR